MSFFTIFDAQLQTAKPNAWALNLQRSDTLYEGALYASGFDGSSVRPNQAKVEALVAATTSNFVSFDIESYALTNADYGIIRGWARAIRGGNVRYGFYGLAPVLSANIGSLFGIAHPAYSTWKAANDALAGAIANVDFLAPTLYWRQSTVDINIVNTAAHIAEAKRICQGKPIYPWIWPENANIAGTFYTQAEWTRYMTALKTGDLTGVALGTWWDESWRNTGCDGAILWGNLGETWDSSKGWYIAQQAFNAANRYSVRLT